MHDPKASSTSSPQSAEGFGISDQPIVRSNGHATAGHGALEARGPGTAQKDLLYVIARDPRSLFIYWDLNWTRLFAAAGVAPCQVHLRIYRGNEAVEGTHEINPFRGHHYAEVSSAGSGYYCELGCLAGEEWTKLVRSGRATTPADRMSDDLAAQFATLPLHLSFQRALEILRVTQAESPKLANFVAELQEKAKAAPGPATGQNGETCDELNDLRQAAPPGPAPTAGEIAQWKRLWEELGGASWGGASGSGFGGSSRT